MTNKEAKAFLTHYICSCPYGNSPTNCGDNECKFGIAVRTLCVEERPTGRFIINYEALVKDIEYRNEHNKCPKEYAEGARDTLEIAKLFISELSNNAPTVERPRGEWIPVSERLPDDMQRVLIWFEYYRYGDYNCMYQTYGFGYVCDGKWSPFINGETGWQDARIIAWQPLPEPYKEVSNDTP